MKMPNLKDYITITSAHYVEEKTKLNILKPSEVVIKEKTDAYIVIESSLGIVEVSDMGAISLVKPANEIKINKGESKKLTLPLMDYFGSVIIKY